MGRLRCRWILGRLGIIVFVLLAMQFLSQLGMLTIQNPTCDEILVYKERALGNVRISPSITVQKEVIIENDSSSPPQTSNLKIATRAPIVDQDLKKVANDLKRLANDLSETQRSLLSSVIHYHRVGQHLQLVNNILRSLGERGQTFVNTGPLGGNKATENSNKQEVCPEVFMGKTLAYGYPYFRKGFDRVNCTDFVPLNNLVTIVTVLPEELSKDERLRVLHGIAANYPNMRVILATKDAFSGEHASRISQLKLNFHSIVLNDFSEGVVWSRLLREVSTPYVLIARDLTHFTDDVDLERLIRILSHNKEAVISAGSYRNLQGEWDIGCLQVSFKNWTAYFRGGYYRSFSECVICDVLSGPFVAKTQRIKKIGLDDKLSFGVFQDFFWRLKLEYPAEVAVSCPDVMFNVYQRDTPDANYAQLANKWEVKKWVESNGRVRWYGCRHGYSHTRRDSCRLQGGLAVPPCDLENLADAIKFVMRVCEEAGLFCELQEGTLLGAVKFNKVLPWERDADITFLTANYSAFKGLRPKFSAAGYSFSSEDSSLWCCVDGRQAGGKFRISTTRWTLELYGQHKMESEMLVASGQRPTKVQLAGQWVTAMRNPGLFARNRYGPYVYRHAEHWMENTGQDTGWAFYTPSSFKTCPTPGHSGCLDMFSADGNLQFSDYPLI